MSQSPQHVPEASPHAPSFDDVLAARQRIAPHVHRTPVLTSSSLNEIAGASLFFKCENLQRSGSFKMRGASNAVFSLSEEDAARGVVTHSSGNHAAALVLAARRRGIRAWIVMPLDSPQIKRRGVAAFGGEITLCEPTLAAREAAAREVMKQTGATLIHPYDDDRIIAGQATAAVELIEEIPDLDLVLAPVSGGGLLSGIGIATRHMLPSVRVVGCEPAQADDAARSLAAGRLMPASGGTTMADGLRATLSPRTLAILQRTVDSIALVKEAEISAAMRLLWERLKLIVEPSGAVAAAPAFLRQIHGEGKRIGIVLSGGNVDFEALPFIEG